MKSILLTLLIIFIVIAPPVYLFRDHIYRTAYRILTKSFTFSSEKFDRDLCYRLYIPKIKKNVRYPLIVSLHGAAERGSDNLRQIDGIASTFISRKIQRKNPAFVFIPQCPENTQWLNTGFTKIPFGHYEQSSIPESPEMKMVIAVINQLIAQYPIDSGRIYIGGFSMGASGTWDIISRHPDLFAAAFVMAGVSDTSTAEKIKEIPVWAFNGSLDHIAPPSLNTEMYSAIIRAGGNCKLTVYDKTGHYCVHQAMKEPGFIEWLFSQKKITE
jgi:predicted peptidase